MWGAGMELLRKGGRRYQETKAIGSEGWGNRMKTGKAIGTGGLHETGLWHA